MANIKFSFLYRDAGNYKTYGEVVFANPDGLHPELIKSHLLLACNPDGCFDPRPWGLPNIRTRPHDLELDHDWYEFDLVACTSEPNSDERTVAEFLKLVSANPLRSPF